MSINRVAGYPDLGSTSASKYTPALYAKKLLIKFYAKTVFGEIANRDYEGEISKVGDKILIRTRPDVAVFDYTKGMDLSEKRQTPESPNIELDINYAKAYSIGIDDIDKLQNDINALDEWAQDASEQLGIAIDRSVINAMWASADAANQGLTAGKISASYNLGAPGTNGSNLVTLTKANILDYIVYCDACLSEQNVPIPDRWMILPEWAKALINTSDLRSALFTGDSSNQSLRNGKIGQISNFTIYASNNVTSVAEGTATCWPIMFGHKSALTFASQLVKNRTMELQNTFGSVMEGLHVYGFQVVKSPAMGYIYCKKG
jgi:hypothetical protein